MSEFWKNKRVLITGHTGFKGAWLTLMLERLGARVSGYALKPLDPSLFRLLYPDGHVGSIYRCGADIRDYVKLQRNVEAIKPQIVIHMAAQAEMGAGYLYPLETFEVNTMGTIKLLEALRRVPDARSIVVVTTDKVYADSTKYGRVGYGEMSELGGADPYSCSKSCADMSAQMFGDVYLKNRVAIARSGNVIGGGDWASNRLIPNCIRAIKGEHELTLYDPEATRPWQHVIDCLRGYMTLAEMVYLHPKHATSWNFGSLESATTKSVVDHLFRCYGVEPKYNVGGAPFAEAKELSLNSTAAKWGLGWTPRFDLKKAVELTAQWHMKTDSGMDARMVCLAQIEENYA